FRAFPLPLGAPPAAPCIRQTLCPRTAGARHCSPLLFDLAWHLDAWCIGMGMGLFSCFCGRPSPPESEHSRFRRKTSWRPRLLRRVRRVKCRASPKPCGCISLLGGKRIYREFSRTVASAAPQKHAALSITTAILRRRHSGGGSNLSRRHGARSSPTNCRGSPRQVLGLAAERAPLIKAERGRLHSSQRLVLSAC